MSFGLMNPPSIVYYIRKPQSNPPFSGPFGFIGGFVFTQFPVPHPLKRLHHYARPSERDLTVNWDVEAQLRSGVWNHPPVTPQRCGLGASQQWD